MNLDFLRFNLGSFKELNLKDKLYILSLWFMVLIALGSVVIVLIKL